MLQEKAKAAASAGRMRRVLFINSFFMTRLSKTDGSYNYKNVRN